MKKLLLLLFVGCSAQPKAIVGPVTFTKGHWHECRVHFDINDGKYKNQVGGYGVMVKIFEEDKSGKASGNCDLSVAQAEQLIESLRHDIANNKSLNETGKFVE